MPALPSDCRECFDKVGNGWSEEVRCALHLKRDGQPKALRKYRVTWTERYCQDRMAENAEQAIEERDDDDDNAFEGCDEASAELVHAACDGDGCDGCENRGVVAE